MVFYIISLYRTFIIVQLTQDTNFTIRVNIIRLIQFTLLFCRRKQINFTIDRDKKEEEDFANITNFKFSVLSYDS